MASNLWKAALLVLVLAVYAAAGWSAIHMEGIPRWVRNGAEVTGDGGVRFPAPGMARTPGPPPWLSSVIRSSTIEVEMEARTYRLRQSGPARLLTLSRSTSLRNLTLGQDGADLVIRMRTPSTSLNGEPPHTIRGVFGDEGQHRIRLLISGSQFQAWIDGKAVESATLPGNPLSVWDPDYPLVLGNEVGGQRPWLGEIRRATVRAGGKSYEYATGQNLVFPGHYWTMGPAPKRETHEGGSGGSWKQVLFRRPDVRDWTLNLLGFLPLGFLLIFLWRRLPLSRAFLVCALVSLVIETGQIFLPGRDPQWLDFVLNTSGGFLGAVLARSLSWLTRPSGNLPPSGQL